MTAESPRHRLGYAVVFAAALAAYLCNGRALVEVDCVTAPYTALAVVRTGGVDLTAYADRLAAYDETEVAALADGRRVSVRPIGQALAQVPFVAPVAAFTPGTPSAITMEQVGKVASAVYVALSVVLFAALVRRYAPAAVVPATLLFALGTSLWSTAAMASWAHGPATFGLTLGLYFLLPGAGISASMRASALAGLVMGLAATARPTAALFVAGSAAALLFTTHRVRVVALCAAAAVPFALLAWFQHATFGDPVLGGYARQTWTGRPPFWYAAAGLLISPSRGLFVYSPALIFAAVGLVAATRRLDESRSIIVAWALTAAATVAYYSRWPAWHGGWCYGPRFFCELMPVMCLLVALAWAGLARPWRLVATSLIAVSVLVHGLGVFGRSAHEAWHLRHLRTPAAEDLFELHDTQILAHAKAAGRKLAGGR